MLKCLTLSRCIDSNNRKFLTDADPVVSYHPKSRLVPLGMEVTFTCKIRNAINAHWVIGRQALISDGSIRMAETKGYFIEVERPTSDVTLLTLTFNVTMDKNRTQTYCSSLATNSNVAVLLAISGMSINMIKQHFYARDKFS